MNKKLNSVKNFAKRNKTPIIVVSVSAVVIPLAYRALIASTVTAFAKDFIETKGLTAEWHEYLEQYVKP